jgi:hypothetical protein
VKLVLLLIMTRAPRNSFQDMMNANRATVTMAGTDDGRNTRISTCQDEAPSTVAASVSSRGMAAKLLRRM